MNERNMRLSRVSQAIRSKATMGSKVFDNININVDNELEHFVSQIEENTFAILSIKQKFSLMQKNGLIFKDETIEKLNSFEKQINEIEEHVTSTFQSFNHRLDHMELLGFRPASYHPAKIITINDNHQITCAFYSSDFVYIGTDTSRIIIFSGRTMQFNNEIGPLDGSPVVFIGLVSRAENPVLAARTSANNIHIIDIQRPSQKRVLISSVFTTWPTNLPSKYRMVTLEEEELKFYGDDLTVEKTLSIKPQKLFAGPDRLITVTNDEVTVYNIEEEIVTESNIKLPFAPTLLSSSRSAFVAASGADDRIAVIEFSGDFTTVDAGGPSRFLFTWGSYYFRVGDDTLVQCFSFAKGKEDMITIGDPAWWPHAAQTPLAACGIMESTLLTALDLKCVLWN